MSPELRGLIYASIIGVIVTALTALIKLAVDKLGGRKTAPIDRGKAITDLADAMVDVSTKAVTSLRAELESAQADLSSKSGELAGARAELAEGRNELADARRETAAARDELTATKRMMETREADHAAVLGRMRRRIAQLVQVLTDNNLAVPDEEGDLLSTR